MSKLTFKQRRVCVLEQLEKFSLIEIKKSKIPQPDHSAGFLASELNRHFNKDYVGDHMRFIDLIYYTKAYEDSRCYRHIGDGIFDHKGSFKEFENQTISDIICNKELPGFIFKIFEGYINTELKDIPMYSNLEEVHKNVFRICLERLSSFKIDYYDCFKCEDEYSKNINDYIFRYDKYRGVMDRVTTLYRPIWTFGEDILNQFGELYTEHNIKYDDFNFNSITTNFDLISLDFLKNVNNYDKNKKLLFQFICYLVESKLNKFKDTVVFDIHYDICFSLIEALHLYNNYKLINFNGDGYIWSNLYWGIERKVTLMNDLDTLMNEIKDDTFKNLFCTIDTINEIKDDYSKKAFLQLYTGCKKLNVDLNVDENIDIDEDLLKSILEVCNDIFKEPIQFVLDKGIKEFCRSLGSVDYDFSTLIEALYVHYNKIDSQPEDCESKNDLDETCKTNDQSINNGGKTDYYKIDPKWEMLQDVIEDRDMNFSQGNILKAAFCFNTDRHSGTNYKRELNKIIYFAQRELDRIG